MKSVKAIACVLSATMLVGVFAGCSKTTKISTDKFAKACEKLKLEEFDIDDGAPDMDDLEDGFYCIATEDQVEDEDVDVEYLLREMGLSEVIDSDDVTSLAIAAKCSGLDDLEDISDPEDLADVLVDGAFAAQISLGDDGYAKDFMEYLEDMLDIYDISTKDLSNQEYFCSDKEGYLRFHVDVSKFAKLVIDNDDIMDLVDMYSDADDFEDAMNALTGDVAVTVEINGTNIFILAGGAINSKTTVLSSFASAFGAVNNPTKVPMNEDVVSDMVDAAVDYVTSAMYGSYSYDDYDYDYDYDYDDDDYDYDEDED